ncbi:hypothetical protein C9J48_13150 [Photobacterium profundum]|uniref:RND efflux pump membrane fusion protein barrel-sandwich domain-containing protein n=2 Tax=Photobacterium profundum TaxID=74109 RepID=Q1Z0I6_9GAMM|nr:HlyD family efflux transporter periplasmic adaptor subunit [Photobacterium profundum]EAS41986.1 hypothetical protein P3TCK_11764 [Photobacterium profundum 3TCK]PSV61933.1 hypothetical protein C9J48_13150 [Photobacterium profundum]
MKVEFHLDKQRNPESEKGMKIVYGAAKRGGYRIRWYFILALVLSPILIMIGFFIKDYVLITAPGIITTNPVTLSAPHNGTILNINVDKGQQVEEHQHLIKLVNSVLDSDITFLKNELKQIRKQEEHAVNINFSTYRTAINDAKNNLKAIAKIKAEYDKYLQQGQVSQVDYAAIINLENGARQGFNRATIEYSQAYATEFQTTIAGPVAQVKRRLKQELANKVSQKEALNIVSPYNGSIVEILVTNGQRVEYGTAIATISPMIPPKVIAYLAPKYVNNAILGNRASVRFPDGSRYQAEITEPTEIASKLPPQLARPFEGQPALLKVTLTFTGILEKNQWVEGMPVEVHF